MQKSETYYRPAQLTIIDANWFIKDRALCYHVYVIMHVKDHQLLVTGLGYRVLVAGSVCSFITCTC